MTEKESDAFEVYMTGQFSQKEIAKFFGVTEPTVSKWAKIGKWEEERSKRFSSQREIERRAWKAIDYTMRVMERHIDDNDEKGTFVPIDAKITDSLSRVLKAVKPRDIKLINVINLCNELLEYLRRTNIDLAKAMIEAIQGFIEEKRQELANDKF